MMMVGSEPIELDQAMNDSNWLAVMQEGLRANEKNKTWELVKKSIKKPINVKWVYKLKLRPNGEIVKHKARLVVRGFFLLQKPGINFAEVYVPLERLETVKLIVSTVTYKGWKIQ